MRRDLGCTGSVAGLDFGSVGKGGEPAELEEERRLCYVGITRARERLYLTSAAVRMMHGATQYNPPSRFLKELPSDLVTDVTPPRRERRRSGSSWSGGGFSSSGDGWSGDRDRSGEPGGRVFGGGRARLVESAIRSGERTPTAPSSTGAEDLGLAVGDRVKHRKWGEGIVLEVAGSGDKAEAAVRFASAGEKRLLLSWAPLERVD